MRFAFLILILLFTMLGIVFGALNNEIITLDFYWANVALPKGAALLSALLAGWIIGGLILYFGIVLRLRRRLRRLSSHRDQAGAAALVPEPPPA